jgi:hypothetical protein
MVSYILLGLWEDPNPSLLFREMNNCVVNLGWYTIFSFYNKKYFQMG